ncbi:hypothetical protein [Cetobacterium sp.]|uniref:hypothetical protein n=1 Tax=Cetobacterium sp. TaxID=2071632 RepID=UPI003EE750C9
MKKIILILLNLIFCKVVFSALSVKIYEPIRFSHINTTMIGEEAVAEGTLEIVSNNLDEDFQKKLKFRFPNNNLMTNRKRWLKVKRVEMDNSKKELIVTSEKMHVKFYAVIDRKELNSFTIPGEILEGEYIGIVPMIIEEYGKPVDVIDGEELGNSANSDAILPPKEEVKYD